MAEFPALPLFTDAFIGDTTHLDATETGAYLMLLIVAWRSEDCSLPNNDVILSRYARLDMRRWLKIKPIVLSFWQLGDDNRYRQNRLTDEKKYVEGRRAKNVQAGNASALKRKKRHSTNVITETQHNSNVNPTNPQPTTHNPQPTSDRDKVLLFDSASLPSWVPLDAWDAWIEVRKKNKKAAQTQYAIDLAIAKLAGFKKQGFDIKEIINNSILNGYPTFYPPRDGNSRYNKPTSQGAGKGVQIL